MDAEIITQGNLCCQLHRSQQRYHIVVLVGLWRTWKSGFGGLPCGKRGHRLCLDEGRAQDVGMAGNHGMSEVGENLGRPQESEQRLFAQENDLWKTSTVFHNPHRFSTEFHELSTPLSWTGGSLAVRAQRRHRRLRGRRRGKTPEPLARDRGEWGPQHAKRLRVGSGVKPWRGCTAPL